MSGPRLKVWGMLALIAFVWIASQWIGPLRDEFVRWEATRPAPRRAIRPADFTRYPRSTFGLILEDGNGNRVDTFSGSVAKDLGDHDSTIALTLSTTEIDTLYQMALEMRLFDFPEPHPPFKGSLSLVPNTTMRLEVRAGDSTRVLTWSTGYVADGAASDDWKRLLKLVSLLRHAVWRRPEYQQLPRGPLYM